MEPFSCFSGSVCHVCPLLRLPCSHPHPPFHPIGAETRQQSSWYEVHMGEKQLHFTKCLPVAQKRLLHTLYPSAPRPSLSADSPLASGLIVSRIQGEYPAKRQLPEDCCWFRLRLRTHSGDCYSTWIGALSFQRHLGRNEAETWAAATTADASAGQFCMAPLVFLEVIFYWNGIRVERFQFNTFKWSDFYSFPPPPPHTQTFGFSVFPA